MATVSQITVPNGSSYAIKDADALRSAAAAPAFSSSASYAVDAVCSYDGKVYRANQAHSGAWNAAHFTEVDTIQDQIDGHVIPYGALDPTSTATVMTVTVSPPITRLEDGVCIFVKNGVITSAANFTIDVNGLGPKPVYSSMAAATRETTIFNVAYTMMFMYDSTRVEGGCWVLYRGYDSNTNTIAYSVRGNYATMTASQKGYRYRLWFTSADGKHWVPANTSSSTNNTAKRTPNTTAIDPFGRIVYNSTNATVSAGDSLPTATLWSQYALSLGYSFNDTGAALTLTFPCPVWIKCQPQTNGSALLKGYVQSLPSTADGFIYIYLGNAYTATSVEMFLEHPVYYHDGTGIRAWTGATPAAPATTSPAMDGTAAVGTSTLYARGDHVHPSDTSRQAKITASGLLKGNGSGGVSAATAGTDYQAPLSAYTSTPAAATATGSAGSSSAYSKGDHAHPAETLVVTGTVTPTSQDLSTFTCTNLSSTFAATQTAIQGGQNAELRLSLQLSASVTWTIVAPLSISTDGWMIFTGLFFESLPGDTRDYPYLASGSWTSSEFSGFLYRLTNQGGPFWTNGQDIDMTDGAGGGTIYMGGDFSTNSGSIVFGGPSDGTYTIETRTYSGTGFGVYKLEDNVKTMVMPLDGSGYNYPNVTIASSGADTYELRDRTMQLITLSDGTSTATLVMPTAAVINGARDFVVDVDNRSNASDLGLEISGLGATVALCVPDTTTLADLTLVGAGEVARLYFSESGLSSGMASTFAVHRLNLVVVTSMGDSSSSPES